MAISLDEKLEELWARLDSAGYESLSGPERAVINVRLLVDATENGGAISYFYNSGADTLDDCFAALRELGADEVGVQLRRLCALFPSGVPSSVEARNEVISSWPGTPEVDELLEEIDDLLLEEFPALERALSNYFGRHVLAT